MYFLKLFFTLIFFINLLFSKEISFEEKKYIAALNNELVNFGTLNITDKTIILKYNNSDDTIFYDGNDIKIINQKEEITTLSFEENPEYSFFFSLADAVYKNDFSKIKNDFSIQKNKIITLTPKQELSNIFEIITFEKNNLNEVKYIKIDFTNGDKIIFSEINK